MRLFNRYLFWVAFLGMAIATAQPANIPLSGRVTDFVTADPLENVTIHITNQNSGVTDSTTTDAAGFWSHDLVTAINQPQVLPARFRVFQNYPNPFNPSTTIAFDLPLAGEVTVTVYNALGAVVDERKAMLNAGAHVVTWRATGSAGVYFVRIHSRQASQTIKMVQLDGGQGEGLGDFQPGVGSRTLAKQTAMVPVRITASRFAYLTDTLETTVSGGEYFDRVLETLHSSSLLWDLHNDVLEKMILNPSYHLGELHTYNHTDIPRMKTGGVDAQFFVVWVNPNTHGNDSYAHAMAMVDIFHAELAMNPADMVQAETGSDVSAIVGQEKIAAIMCVEGGHAIENDLDKLIALYDAGMRYLTITWNNSTNWAISAKDSRSTTVGLSEFGKQVIRTLDSLGVVIDVSHVGIKTISDILDVTQNPIIASHSGARTLRNHYRNLYDSQIIDIANSGGVVGVVFYPPFLSNSGSATIATVVNHIDHIVNLVGIDHVGLGSDFDGIGTNTVQGLYDVTTFPALTEALLARGYSPSDVKKILGKNMMRVFQQVTGN